jgi:ParB-like chromosome segregation protein Spo0J
MAQHYHTIEHIGIARLRPCLKNARTHSRKQIRQIADSIKRFGFTNPVLIGDDDEIIAGHGRVEAAKLVRMESVPTVRLSHLDAAQRRAYVIADNKLALNAGWDNDLLKIELGDLQAFDFDLGLIGFSADEIAGLTFDRSGLTDPDEAPDAPAIPVSAPGDVWLLGKRSAVWGRV